MDTSSAKRTIRAAAERTRTLHLLESMWDVRPTGRPARQFQKWLRNADRLDNERMQLVLAAVVAPDSNCIDIGAAGGEFLANMIRLAPFGHHLAYEPLDGEFDRLSRQYPGVDVRRAAVTNINGEIDFTVVENGRGWSGIRPYEIQTLEPPELHQVRAPAVRLDDDLPPDYVPAVIKIDVNGAEGQLLEGASETLRRHQPVVLIEHGRAAAAYGVTSGDVYERLATYAGLRLFDLEGNGPLTEDAFTEAARTKWNFLARP